MTINNNNLLNKISSSTSDVVISTLTAYMWVATDIDNILLEHQNKDLFFVWWVNKDFVNQLKDKKKSSRTSDSDIVEKNYFFIDIDIRKSFYEDNHVVLSQEKLLKHIDAIKDILNLDPLFKQWSFINCSWNWMHVFYIGKHIQISDTIYKLGVKRIYEKFVESFWDRIQFPIDPSCCNIGKLVRLPWSVNHKTDYQKDGIRLVPCEILYEQDIESELFNNIPWYVEESKITQPEKSRDQWPKLWITTTIPGSLMEKINQKQLVDLVIDYTWRYLASDDRNFMGGKNSCYKWCFMHENYKNVLIMDGTPHIPNPNNLQAHTTFTFIRDALCNGDSAQAFKKAKELYPDLKNDQEPADIWNPFDHFIDYGELTKRAVKERRALDINTVCKYWVKILDEYLGWILPSELVVIWADTGVGKSDIAYNLALCNANRWKKVLLFWLEWDINEIALRHIQRLISESSQTPIKTMLYRFNIDKSIYKIEDEVVSKISDNTKNNLFLFNKLSVPSIWFIKDLIEKTKDSVDMIVIDHLHYIYLDRDDELRQIGDIMRTLKTISDIIKKPIVLVSHLRKKDNKVKERDPEISDLYWSSNIGKEATTVLLLTKIRAVDVGTVWIELPEDQLDKRYMWTKIIVPKSRIGLPKSSFWLIYDLDQKKYLDYFQGLMEDESWAKVDDKLTQFEETKI